MQRYHTIVKIEKIKKELQMDHEQEALEMVKTIPISKIKSMSDLSVIAEVYYQNEDYETAKKYFLHIYEKTKSRRVLWQLIRTLIRLKQVDEAELCLSEFIKLAPDDFYQYIFRYELDQLEDKPIEDRIKTLEALKEVEYMEQWGYELTKLYHKAGEIEKCKKECDKLILWFGEGEYVERAKALRAYYDGELDVTLAGEDAKRFAKEMQRVLNTEQKKQVLNKVELTAKEKEEKKKMEIELQQLKLAEQIAVIEQETKETGDETKKGKKKKKTKEKRTEKPMIKEIKIEKQKIEEPTAERQTIEKQVAESQKIEKQTEEEQRAEKQKIERQTEEQKAEKQTTQDQKTEEQTIEKQTVQEQQIEEQQKIENLRIKNLEMEEIKFEDLKMEDSEREEQKIGSRTMGTYEIIEEDLKELENYKELESLEVLKIDLELEKVNTDSERTDLELEKVNTDSERTDLELERVNTDPERADLELERVNTDPERTDLERREEKTETRENLEQNQSLKELEETVLVDDTANVLIREVLDDQDIVEDIPINIPLEPIRTDYKINRRRKADGELDLSFLNIAVRKPELSYEEKNVEGIKVKEINDVEKEVKEANNIRKEIDGTERKTNTVKKEINNTEIQADLLTTEKESKEKELKRKEETNQLQKKKKSKIFGWFSKKKNEPEIERKQEQERINPLEQVHKFEEKEKIEKNKLVQTSQALTETQNLKTAEDLTQITQIQGSMQTQNSESIERFKTIEKKKEARELKNLQEIESSERAQKIQGKELKNIGETEDNQALEDISNLELESITDTNISIPELSLQKELAEQIEEFSEVSAAEEIVPLETTESMKSIYFLEDEIPQNELIKEISPNENIQRNENLYINENWEENENVQRNENWEENKNAQEKSEVQVNEEIQRKENETKYVEPIPEACSDILEVLESSTRKENIRQRSLNQLDEVQKEEEKLNSFYSMKEQQKKQNIQQETTGKKPELKIQPIEPRPAAAFIYPNLWNEALGIEEGGKLYQGLLKQEESFSDLFGGFAFIKDVRECLVELLSLAICDKKANFIIAREDTVGYGSMELAKKLARSLYRLSIISSANTALTNASRVNTMNLKKAGGQLKNCCLIIEQAGALNSERIQDLIWLCEELKGHIAVILLDTKEKINALFQENTQAQKVFDRTILLKEYTVSNWMNFIYNFLESQDYEIDVMAEQQLRNRVEVISGRAGIKTWSTIQAYLKLVIGQVEQRNAKLLLEVKLNGSVEQTDLLIIRPQDIRRADRLFH